MARDEACRGPAGRVLLVDSITEIEAADGGHIVVSGSHGGPSAAGFALEVPCRLFVFNDAGVGKEGAGIAGLALLQARGLAACAVAHTSARIGEARDTWHSGVISHLNDGARALGLRAGQPLQAALRRLLQASGGDPGADTGTGKLEA